MPEGHRWRLSAALAMPALMGALGLWAWARLPSGARVAIHFNAAGQPDGWGDASWALFMLPLLSAALLGVQWLLHAFDPRADKLRQSRGAVLGIVLALQLLFGVLQGVIVAQALGHAPDVGQWTLLMTGLLLAVVGNLAGKIRWNHSFGIRTPWTRAHERVWDKTHRFGGRLFFGLGLALAVASFIPGGSGHASALIMGATVAGSLLCVVKSWLLSRDIAAQQ